MAVSSSTSELVRLDETLWEIPAATRPDMRVPARVFADRELLEAIAGDRSLEQLENVATLPGIVEAALAMPDIHQGYGFPVGGVAAMELPDGVVSPGGVGYDINCGVRLLALPLTAAELGGRREPLVHELSRAIPAGVGKHAALSFSGDELDEVLREGPRVLVARGIGREEDIEHTESEGRLPGADPAAVSERAHLRGSGQLGTVGAGNHFIELQRVDHVFDADAARAFGLAEGQLTVLIHSGSRGLGHQVCTDHVRVMDEVGRRYGIVLPDRQLACAPASSPEGRAYLAAMAAAANFAFANRHAITHAVRESVRVVLGPAAAEATRQVYDVAHNVAKVERHGGRELLVHRDPRRLPGGRPAGLHPRQHGHGELRAGRAAGLDDALVRHDLSRRRSRDVADRRAQAHRRRRAAPAARSEGDRRPLPVEQGSGGGGTVCLQGRRARG